MAKLALTSSSCAASSRSPLAVQPHSAALHLRTSSVAVQYDVLGAGYAAFRGMISVCDGTEAKANYWTGWDPFYPNGSSTSVSTRQSGTNLRPVSDTSLCRPLLVQFYALLKLVPDELEFISATRFEVGSGRADWAAPTLARANGKWDVVVPVAPPTPPPTDEWVCTVCEHVYNATADGGGLPFEKLPDTWKCPVRPPPPHTRTHAHCLSHTHTSCTVPGCDSPRFTCRFAVNPSRFTRKESQRMGRSNGCTPRT